MSVQPYSFEPLKKELDKIEKNLKHKNKQAIEDEELIEICTKERRTNVEAIRWCKCGYCEKMETDKECLCCHELDEIKFKKISGKIVLQ